MMPAASRETFFLMAEIYADQKKYQDAVRTLDAGYAQHPTYHQFLVTQAIYLEESKDYGGCVAKLKKVIDIEPFNAFALNFLGYLYAERGENLDQAEAFIRKALEVSPSDGFYLDSLGWVYFKKKDYTRALEYLYKAVTIAPDEGVILEHLGDALVATGQKEQALDIYQKALKTKLKVEESARISEKIKQLQNSSDNSKKS